MQRRRFLALTSASVVGGLVWANRLYASSGDAAYRTVRAAVTAGAPKPIKDISLAVDTVLPADPLVAGDFTATAFGADVYLASKLGYLGQAMVSWNLNFYSMKTTRKLFAYAGAEGRLKAVRAWILDRDNISHLSKDLLSGLLSLSVVGTFEGKPKEVRDHLYEKMGWYDPKQPLSTYHIPCDGYANLTK